MFATLPTGYPRLDFAIHNLRKVAIERPPDTRELATRLRAQYKDARLSSYANLALGAVRKLPFAYFSQGEPTLPSSDSALVDRYWSQDLPSALAHSRRGKRWFTPLFFTYCQNFDQKSKEFLVFAENALSRLKCETADPYVKRMQQLQSEQSFFSPDRVGLKLAESLLDSAKPFDKALNDNFLWPEFINTPLGRHTFMCALDMSPLFLSTESVVDKILAWSRAGAQARYPEARVQLANALLTPWSTRNPPEAIKTKLLNYFVKYYLDPRLLSAANPGHHWQGVSDKARDVIRKWLTGDTLRGFMRILEDTADEIWKYRQKFWMAYYNAGHIEEAWLVLGDHAAMRARQMFADQPTMTYGRFSGGASAEQSVMLLKFGGLVFTEWSHNGSLRAVLENAADAPIFYQRLYHGGELRNVESLDFHNGELQRPQLTHASSENGYWQRKARDFIRRQSGIYLSDRDII